MKCNPGQNPEPDPPSLSATAAQTPLCLIGWTFGMFVRRPDALRLQIIRYIDNVTFASETSLPQPSLLDKSDLSGEYILLS